MRCRSPDKLRTRYLLNTSQKTCNWVKLLSRVSRLLVVHTETCSGNHFLKALCVQVTVHRDNLRTNNQQDVSSIQNFILSRNSTYFGHLLCPSSGVISCTRGNLYVCTYCPIYPVQFLFGVSVLIYCFCLFGIDVLYVQVTCIVVRCELRDSSFVRLNFPYDK